MNPSESVALLKDLLGQELQPRPLLIVAMSVLLAFMFFHVLKRREASPAILGEGGSGVVAVRESLPTQTQDAARPVGAPAPARVLLEDKPLPLIPQDAVLRRHYLAHVKYMIETVTFPRPEESVLRRHYDQLIAAELDSCISDEGHLKRLIRRFEERTRNT